MAKLLGFIAGPGAWGFVLAASRLPFAGALFGEICAGAIGEIAGRV